MRKSHFALSLAALTLGAAALPGAASAQTTPVPVTVVNTTASRTLYVESTTGQPLTSLDFGSGRSLPFRVRVVDGSFTRTPFTVSSTMTNLYLDSGSGPTYATKIASSNVSLGSQTNPLNVLGISAAVQPLVNTISTIADTTICTLLGLTAAIPVGGTVPSCSIATSGLTGVIQNLSVPVNLSLLSNLPLLPQTNDTGPFTNAEFGAGTAGAGDTAGKAAATAASQTPTPLKVISGAPISTSAVLTALQGLLATTPLGSLVPAATVTAALNATLGNVWSLLSANQIDTVLANTVGTAQSLIGNQVLSQTGTYVSLPTLNVSVPGGVPAGQYKGTMVVTALQ